MRTFEVVLGDQPYTVTQHKDGTFELPPSLSSLRGYGTGLKPCFEPILVFRKPLSEKNVHENVLKHGTGAINIDACRVKHSSSQDLENHKAGVEAIKARGGSMDNSWKNSSDLSGANEVTSAGRWPPNCLFSHADGCKRLGEKKVEGSSCKATHVGLGREGNHTKGTYGAHASKVTSGYVGEDGTETVAAWECVEGCPAAALDAQSGNRKSTLAGLADPNEVHEHPGHDTTSESMWFGKDRTFLGKVYADQGGASRFYPQFEGQTEIDSPFLYTGKATKKETTLGGRIENKHVTKKPIKLMSWLVKLVTQKGGITLDPFCGSGSTLHAAILEGMRFTGIERDPESHATAAKRVELVLKDVQGEKTQTSLFDLAMGGEAP